MCLRGTRVVTSKFQMSDDLKEQYRERIKKIHKNKISLLAWSQIGGFDGVESKTSLRMGRMHV